MTVEGIKAVVFDMDGVLCRYDLDRRLSVLSSWSGRRPQEIYEAVFASGFEERAERGELSADEYLDGFSELIGYPLTRSQWAQSRRVAIAPNRLVFQIVAELSRHCATAMLTNNGYLLKELLDAVFPQAAVAFGERAFFSAELGARKPECKVYRRLCLRLGLEPAEVAYVDDDAEYVRSASSVGLRSAHLIHPDLMASIVAELCLDT